VVLTSRQEEELLLPQLTRYTQEGFISEIKILSVTSDIFHMPNIAALNHALEFLADNAPKAPVQYLG
jgi:hypothetical protein